MRSTREVIEHHLASRREGDLDRDLRENYADDVVLLSYEGVHRGHSGVRALAEILATYVDAGDYGSDGLVIDSDYALLRWSATGDRYIVHDGIDSFVVRDGRIVAQTIHYATSPRQPVSVGGSSARRSDQSRT